MMDAPRQDWSLVDARMRETDAVWFRSMPPHDRLALYEDMLRIVMDARRELDGRDRIDRNCWQEKLATRHRMVDAFSKLDLIHRGQAVSHNAV